MYKICDEAGYIYYFNVYKGKENKEKKKNNLSFRVAEILSLDYLGVGRCIVTDNYYSSIDLGEYLLKNNTNLIRTIKEKEFQLICYLTN